ncbi:YidH family protein [Paenibacillus sp. CAA11]|uniref:YidH family protein n=1 Tax=Paenibacillus sp. CAA11 TaxID=1532905 RepID=UPI001F2EFACC|nr:DUF202 domain-containing protein [Paenibacillus sp. CAA11]
MTVPQQEEMNDESKYIQQHLANERTFLAWLRTSIAVVGVGFLAAGLVFNSSREAVAHIFSAIAGISALIFGIAMMIAATIEYRIKRNQINTQSFRSSYLVVNLTFLFMLAIFGLLFGLIYFLLFP